MKYKKWHTSTQASQEKNVGSTKKNFRASSFPSPVKSLAAAKGIFIKLASVCPIYRCGIVCELLRISI